MCGCLGGGCGEAEGRSQAGKGNGFWNTSRRILRMPETVSQPGKMGAERYSFWPYVRIFSPESFPDEVMTQRGGHSLLIFTAELGTSKSSQSRSQAFFYLTECEWFALYPRIYIS